ncbi:hypothetical protein [Aureibacillus halotolerans]|uniref:Uncharacterized protein n=1 Tax=Aureibacillus halotolerans TaxID=1508390 RepID=A0A4R6TXN2_9BACI|nr:hypothetical protein [Aureibacillus halotolerans]TDQ38311.1 hypothetical protein EV213_11052 [Aureibacillus halotolerans]
MKKMLTVTSFTLCLFILTGFVSVSASDGNYSIDENEMDEFLIGLGVPEDVISNLTYLGKLEIFNSVEPDAEFDGFTEKEVSLPATEGDSSIANIPRSSLDLRVTGFSNSDGTYSIYPSFIWKERARLQNDSFGFALNSNNWTTVAGDVGLNIHMVDASPGYTDRYYYDRPSTSNFAGHAFKIPSGDGELNHDHYEGHAHFTAEPNGSNVDRQIILRYGDDTHGAIGTASYSINVGPFSVSFPSSDSNFREGAETLSW